MSRSTRAQPPTPTIAASSAAALSLLALVACEACGKKSSGPAPAPSASAAAQAGTAPAAADTTPAAPDAGAYPGPWISSIVLRTPILSDTDFSKKGDVKAQLIGYLRWGEKAPVLPEPIKKPNCPEGWYELLAGGFVCGRAATLDLDHPKVKDAPVPDLTAMVPYTYGANMANGTPLYRVVPTRSQRMKAEPWLFRKAKPKPVADDDSTNLFASAAGAVVAAVVPDAGATESDVEDSPWWEKDAPDGGPPEVTLEDLEENDGPLLRRMVKGFIVSLDRQFPAQGSMWWKTVSGLTTPPYRILIQKPPTEFHGVWLGRDNASFATTSYPSRRIDKFPMAFVLNGHGKKWQLDDDHKHASSLEGELDHWQAVGLTGQHVFVGAVDYWETDEGWWLRAVDSVRPDPGPAPIGLGDTEKWIDVNLAKQSLVAFEGKNPVYVTLFSSGRNEHETVTGSFRIREKHISATMDADSEIASDGPYSIEDVPYIEYFSGSYALHGAFWHANFGFVKSHGCVNLAPWDAKALFGWTEPQLPEGWHAILATKDHPGTRVIVHGKAPGTCHGPMMDVCEKNERNERAATRRY
jgi:hypothetical protein